MCRAWKEGKILERPDGSLSKDSYKAKRKSYRLEKQRVANELVTALQDPAIVILADWLKVRGSLKGWTKLYCVLKPGLLLLYKSDKLKSNHWVGTILLSSCELIERPSKKDGFCFKLFQPLEQSIWATRGPQGETMGAVCQPLPTSYLIFRAPSQAAGKCWMDGLELALRCSSLLKRSLGQETPELNGSQDDPGLDVEAMSIPEMLDPQEAACLPVLVLDDADAEKHFKGYGLEDDGGSHTDETQELRHSETETDSDKSSLPKEDGASIGAEEVLEQCYQPHETLYVSAPEEDLVHIGESGSGQTEELAEDNRSILWFLLKQVRPGMDLSRVVLPTFILEPRSFLDKLSDYYYHSDFLARAVNENDPFKRMKEVVRWYMSGFYKKPRGLKKPYNPILGETFRCYWLHPNGSRTFYIAEQVGVFDPGFQILTEDEIVDSVKAEATVEGAKDEEACDEQDNKGPTHAEAFAAFETVMAWCEQQTKLVVSHHPPVTACYVSNRKEGFTVSSSILAKSKFYGNSTSAILEGIARLTLLPRGEEYLMTLPYAHCKGLFMGTLTLELGGKVNISCDTTGYCTELEFKLKPFLGGSESVNAISGKISLGKDVLATIQGHWDGQITIRDKRLKMKEVLWSPTAEMRAQRLKRFLVPLDQQGQWESEKLWLQVSEAIRANNQEWATEEKTKLEDQQRNGAKERKLKGEEWVPVYFEQDRLLGEWVYKHADHRPWDQSTDVCQYEDNYVIHTHTRLQGAPLVKSGSLSLQHLLDGGVPGVTFQEEDDTGTSESDGLVSGIPKLRQRPRGSLSKLTSALISAPPVSNDAPRFSESSLGVDPSRLKCLGEGRDEIQKHLARLNFKLDELQRDVGSRNLWREALLLLLFSIFQAIFLKWLLRT
ncbi:unnamed protein product [Darwinula stevensoni]|uniref:PH domain-containing protein n=1 Tax=Darwinula stevensoni TaxID=69355 RepID=A0A7R9AEJ1_9CRUS|nr:unnamed protein product [Darwinula stevensoni]CAG0902089.1 unnamed protein product [Darwinula stevensoni]